MNVKDALTKSFTPKYLRDGYTVPTGKKRRVQIALWWIAFISNQVQAQMLRTRNDEVATLKAQIEALKSNKRTDKQMEDQIFDLQAEANVLRAEIKHLHDINIELSEQISNVREGYGG